MKHSLLLLLLTSAAFAQTGGTYDLSHSVIAGGGGGSVTGGTYRVDGTAGQPTAGTQSSTTPYSFRSGFWMMYSLGPTAATVTISGRVTDATGRGIHNALVTVTAPTGEIQTTQTGQLGYYAFEVTAGGMYLISVANKRYEFANAVRLLNVQDAVSDENFIGTLNQ